MCTSSAVVLCFYRLVVGPAEVNFGANPTETDAASGLKLPFIAVVAAAAAAAAALALAQ